MILDRDEKFDHLLVTLDHNAPPLSENLVLRYFFFLHWRCRRCAAAVPPRVLEHAKDHFRLIESNHPTYSPQSILLIRVLQKTKGHARRIRLQ